MGKRKRKTKLQKPASLAEHLRSNQLWKKPVAKDGSCLFRAVAEQVGLCQESHIEVRHRCADYIAEHKAQFKEFLTNSPEAYADELKDTRVWGGEVELAALSKLYSRSIVVYMESKGKVEEKMFYCSAERGCKTADELTNPIMLAYLDGNHYDIVWSMEHKEATILCQTIVLETINRAMFEVEGGGDTMYDPDTSTYHNFPLEIYQSQKTTMEACSHEVAVTMQFEEGDDCEVSVDSEVLLAKILQLNVSPGKHKVLVKSQNKEYVIPSTNMAIPSNMCGGGAERKGTGQKQGQGWVTHSKPQGDLSPCPKHQINGPCVTKTPGESPDTRTLGEVQQYDWSKKERQHKSEAAGTRVPEVAGTRVTEVAGTRVPEVAGTRVTEVAGTRAPEAAGRRVPEAAGTRVPEAAGTRAPEVAGTRVPEATGTRVPEAAGTRAPEVAGTRVPEAAGRRVPEAAGTRVPEAAGTRVPEAVGTRVHEAAGTRVPEAAGTRVPETVGTRVPEAAGTRVPEAAGTRLPEAAGTRVPEAAGTRLPEAAGTRVPEARIAHEAPEPTLPGKARPVDFKRPSATHQQSEQVNPKGNMGTLSSPQPSSPKLTVPGPSPVANGYDQTAMKSSSSSLHHSHAPVRHSVRVVPSSNRSSHAFSNRSSHTSVGSGTSDDFDLIGPLSGDDEGVCQDMASHDELGRLLRECTQQIPGQLETGAWQEDSQHFNKFQLGVEEDMAHQHRALRVEEDGGSEWPPLEDEANCGELEECVTGIAGKLAGPTSQPLSSEGVVAVTMPQVGDGEDEGSGAQSIMVAPEMIMPAATFANNPLVHVERLAPPSLEGKSTNQFAVEYSLQCLEVYLSHGGGRGDPQVVHLMSQLQRHLGGSKGEVGVASKSPMRLNNEEQHFLFSFQNPSDRTTPGLQLEDITSPGADMVTGSLPYDNNIFTHQAFLPEANPPLLVPPTSVPSMTEVPPLLEPAPGGPSHLHLPPSPSLGPSHLHLPPSPSLGPEEMIPFDPRTLPAFMMPAQLMPPFLPPPLFPMWFPPPHMMPEMMAMMGRPIPYPPLGYTPTNPLLGEREVMSSQLEGQEREEGGEEGAAENEEGKGEEEAECDPVQQSSGLEVVAMVTALHLAGTGNDNSEEHPVEVPPPASVSTPHGPLPSLPRRPAVARCHDSNPQPPADSNDEEETFGSHDNDSQGQPPPTHAPPTRQQVQRNGCRQDNFKNGSRGNGNCGNNYRYPSKRYFARHDQSDRHQVPYEVTRGVADKTLPGDHSSPPSCSPFQSSWSGDQPPSHHQHGNTYPQHHSGVADQSFDSSRSQMTSRSRELRQDWHDYDNVIANQQRMLDKWPKKYPERNPERYPERNPDSYPERYPERNPERYPERNPDSYPERNPERYPERNPERYPERNPEKYPERNPERYPERNPERYPERTLRSSPPEKQQQ